MFKFDYYTIYLINYYLLMFKYFFIWFLANYSYENLLNTIYPQDKPVSDVINFMNKQIEREDHLREQCNLQFYTQQRKSSYENVKDTFTDMYTYAKDLVKTDAYEYLIEPLLYLPQLPLYVGTLQEVMESSYDPMNMNRELIFDNHSYTVLQIGSYNMTPMWSLGLGNHTLTITDIN